MKYVSSKASLIYLFSNLILENIYWLVNITLSIYIELYGLQSIFFTMLYISKHNIHKV